MACSAPASSRVRRGRPAARCGRLHRWIVARRPRLGTGAGARATRAGSLRRARAPGPRRARRHRALARTRGRHGSDRRRVAGRGRAPSLHARTGRGQHRREQPLAPPSRTAIGPAGRPRPSPERRGRPGPARDSDPARGHPSRAARSRARHVRATSRAPRLQRPGPGHARGGDRACGHCPARPRGDERDARRGPDRSRCSPAPGACRAPRGRAAHRADTRRDPSPRRDVGEAARHRRGTCRRPVRRTASRSDRTRRRGPLGRRNARGLTLAAGGPGARERTTGGVGPGSQDIGGHRVRRAHGRPGEGASRFRAPRAHRWRAFSHPAEGPRVQRIRERLGRLRSGASGPHARHAGPARHLGRRARGDRRAQERRRRSPGRRPGRPRRST